MAAQKRFWGKLKSLAVLTVGGSTAFAAINISKGNEHFYEHFLMPTLHLLDPEQAHRLAIVTAKWGLIPQSKYESSGNVLETTLWGLKFANPIGIAAGFDKNGEAVSGLFKSGIGFLEVGSITPLPQDGNAKPRVFRLSEDKAVINRYGFNSDGHQLVKSRLQSFNKRKGVLGVNLGRNKLSESAEEDYAEGVKQFCGIADYIVVNISSPNTPGLRALQMQDSLERLLDIVLEARNNCADKMIKVPVGSIEDDIRVEGKKNKPPILVKIAPDLSYEEKKNIVKAIQRKGKEVDGLIICNTTISRPDNLVSQDKSQVGGLSGKPLLPLSIQTIKEMYELTKGQIPIVGVGGISSGRDAYDVIRAGASLIQVYSALVYHGPPLIDRIKKELETLAISDGYSNIKEAIGADHSKS